MATESYISIITLNVNVLNTPTKRQRMAERKKKKKKTTPLRMLSTRDPPQNKGHILTESERLEKDISANGDQRKQEWQYSYQIKLTLK